MSSLAAASSQLSPEVNFQVDSPVNPSANPSANPSVNSPGPCRIFIIEDDHTMADCLALALRQLDYVEPVIFGDAIAAIQALDGDLPKLIFLDVLLDGPDGFAFLNELNSYSDTADIPVVIVSSLSLLESDLRHYGVVKVLDKETMQPKDIIEVATRYAR